MDFCYLIETKVYLKDVKVFDVSACHRPFSADDRLFIGKHTRQTTEDHFRESLSDQMMKYYDNQWEVMDFVNIAISLASRLTPN